MPVIRFTGFIGEIPKVLSRLLPDMASQSAFNVRLDDGGLTPIRESRFVHHFRDIPGEGYKTIYCHNGDWLAWESIVHAVPAPVAEERLYITGDGEPKVRVAGQFYPLFIQHPTEGLTGEVTGEVTKEEITTRLYVYTNVRILSDGVEEETEPSPASEEIDWQPGQQVTLTGFTVPKEITKQRIYRLQSGRFFFIAEREASTKAFIDDIPLDSIVEPLPSMNWNAPPDDLEGLTSLPNGMMAAFAGKELCFSEPWRPHAWPEKYRLVTDFPIVGLGAYGSTIAVMTTGKPYIVSGTSPDSMVMEKTELNLPCISARGIVDLGYAIAYPSTTGLVTISQGGAQVVTSNLISSEHWKQMNPGIMIAGQINGRYLAKYHQLSGEDIDRQGTMIIDMSGEQPFIIRTDDKPQAFWYEIESGSLYYLQEGNVYEWDAHGKPMRPLSWTSKQFIVPKACNFGAILIEKEEELSDEELAWIREKQREAEEHNKQIFNSQSLGGALGGNALNQYPVNGDKLKIIGSGTDYVIVNVYAGKERRLVAGISKTGKSARLPSGFIAREWEIEVGSNTTVAQITIATTAMELAQ